jgi:hypothetical protein
MRSSVVVDWEAARVADASPSARVSLYIITVIDYQSRAVEDSEKRVEV